MSICDTIAVVSDASAGSQSSIKIATEYYCSVRSGIMHGKAILLSWSVMTFAVM